MIEAGEATAGRSHFSCQLCGQHHHGDMITMREMMFGTREEFDYFLCDNCCTLQIAQVPDNLAAYYAADAYYSFGEGTGEARWKSALKRICARGMIGRPEKYPMGNGPIDRIRRGAEPWIAQVEGLWRDAAVLDVGCGKGARLEALARLGFTDLSGVDPFLPATQEGTSVQGIHFFRGELTEIDGHYDLITMHHSLEHVAEPRRLLVAARERLKPGGRIFVRIPLLQDWVWRKYGANWAQIDAPRHFYLMPQAAFIDLAKSAGLDCISSGTDTLGWSLARSEAYARDIPMYNSPGQPNALPFTMSELAEYDRQAQTLNAAGEGDQGYFVLSAA